MFEAGRMDLTESEREAIALALADALMPYGRDFDAEDAARLLTARLSALLAARGQRGYHEGWKMRAGEEFWQDDAECTCGHFYDDHVGEECKFYGCGCGAIKEEPDHA